MYSWQGFPERILQVVLLTILCLEWQVKKVCSKVFSSNFKLPCTPWTLRLRWILSVLLSSNNLVLLVVRRLSYHQWWLMGATLIVNNLLLALVLPGTHLLTLQGERLRWSTRTRIFGDLMVWDPRGIEPVLLSW